MEHLGVQTSRKFSEESEGSAALGAELVSLVEDGRDSALLGEGREGDWEVIQILVPEVVYVSARGKHGDSCTVFRGAKEACKVTRVYVAAGPQNIASKALPAHSAGAMIPV